MGFKYLNKAQNVFDADDAEDFHTSSEQLEARLEYFTQQLALTTTDADKIKHLTEIAFIQIDRYKGEDAWQKAFEAFNLAVSNKLWEEAAIATDALFLAEGPESLKALAHGIWLGVSFPIDAEITVALLQHLIDESPKEADTRAIAAASAHYVTSMRCGKDDDLTFFTQQMLTSVADGHSNVVDQSTFDLWFKTLNLDDPQNFLPKLSGALDILTDGAWWFDKAELQQEMNND
jgi:hypothetical protein